MKTLTVFTPTYNRAKLLERCYNSLRHQTCKEFKWLVIDDGSTDDTEELVNSWMTEENGFETKYIKKSNGGLYSGYITAINNIDTEICVCVDSDDYLTDRAVELILDFWKRKGSNKYAGIIGLDVKEDGNLIGDSFPENLKTINLIDTMTGRAVIKEVDWKNVVRTELYRESIPPKNLTDTFCNEKDFNPHYLHIKICESYDFLVLNEPLCVVDYQPNGMTATVFKQYLRSPNSFRVLRLLELSYRNAPFKYRAKKAIHYVSSSLLAKKPCVSESPQKILTVLMIPFGVILTGYLIIKNALHDRKEHNEKGYN